MPPIGKNVKKSGIPTPDAPIVTLNDSTNILIASSPLGDSEIEMSINNASFVQYTGQINIGDVALPEGYYKFRIKKNTTRNSSSITKSPGATKGTNISLVTPVPPTVISDDINDTVYATHSLGASEIVISVNNGGFSQYNGATINVGNVNLASGYYRFKIKSATGRNESNVANSDAFTFTANTTPVAPTISQDDVANSISASHPLGISEILVSSNNGTYTQYTATIFVGNVDQVAGYWKFKTKAAPGRNESPIASSTPFTSTSQQNTTPVAPTIIADDTADTLSATHPLGTSEIIYSINGSAFTQYNGSVINVGNVNLASGYYQFKTKAVTGRNESSVAISPAFTGSFIPARTYYISNSGNINNSGSPTSPWPISKLFQGSSFPDGTAFLFNRGETFVGRVVPYITNNVLYDAYGTGAKPIFTTMAGFPNASVASNWTQQAGLTNVWTLIINPFTNYTPRVWLNGTEYQRAKLKTDVTATKRTCWENTDNQYFHVYSVGNPTTYYTSIQTASFTNNTMDISGQNNCTVRNLDIRGSQGASLDCGFCSNLVIENCNIGRDGNREGVRVNTINGMVVRNNLFDTGERIMQDFNLSNEGGDGFLVGQGDTQNVEVYNNTFLNWRHAGILVEGDNANTILQNIHIYNNEASSPDIEYGRAVACYFYHSTNVVIENNNFHHLAIQNQFAATGLIFRNNTIENVRNNPYMDMGTGIGIAIGHAYFTPTNMQFLNNTIKDCYNSGIEMNGHLGNTGAYADVKDNIFQGNIFINNGWNVKNPFYDPTFSPLNCDIVIRDNLDVLNNSYINNSFVGRSSTDKCVYYGHDPVDSYLKTITEFGGMNGTAGDIITGNIIANNNNTTPVAPTLQADDTANTLSASHVLGISEIVYSENGGGFIAYTGQINVGNVARAIGYWQFKIKAATGRNESAVVSSPAFTVTNITPAPDNTYSLTSAAKVSSGVYNGDYLLRTLDVSVPKLAGSNVVEWDGKDNEGNPIDPTGKTIQVTSHNVNYEWLGVIGNTSANMTGNTIHTGYYYSMIGMAQVGNYIYYATAYVERKQTVAKFNINSPQVRIPIQQDGNWSSVYYVATDGTNVYFASSAEHGGGTEQFVYAINAATDQDITFSVGTPFGNEHNSVIDYVNNINAKTSGFAVSTNFIFVSHADINELHVLNKTTGALVQNLSMIAPKSLVVEGNTIWVAFNNDKIEKFNINSNGTLTTTGLVITGLTDIIAASIAAGNVLVAQAGNIQQVKAYDKNTGVQQWILGQLGGYKNYAGVSDDRFDFEYTVFIMGNADGSFWLGDTGNHRALKHNASRVVIDRIAFLPSTYAVAVVQNEPTRVIAEFLEYSIDWSKPIQQSWSLVRNYKWTQPYVIDGLRKYVKVVKLSNGRTYALGASQSTTLPGWRIMELTVNGVRDATTITSFPRFYGVVMRSNGDLIENSQLDYNINVQYRYYTLTGFNSAGDPLYSAPVSIGSTPVMTSNDPFGNVLDDNMTSTDVMISFSYETPQNTEFHKGYHLGAIKKGTNGQWLWRTAKATRTDYYGPYPPDGRFDIGNNTNYAGGLAVTLERSIFWNHHGEFWKGSQTNMMHHIWDNGLQIDQFGYAAGNIPFGTAGMAGNSLCPQYFKVGTDYYVITGDESFHSGLGLWKITNLSSITTQTIPAKIVTIPKPGVDLMAGLTPYSTLVNDVAGWARVPATNSTSPLWNIKTMYRSYDNIDIYAERDSITTCYFQRDLGNINSISWSLTGKINFEGTNLNRGDMYGDYVEVIDNTNKIISRFYIEIDPITSVITGYVNGVILFQGARDTFISFVLDRHSFSLTKTNSGLVFTYAQYSASIIPFTNGAVLNSPKYAKFTLFGNPNGPGYGTAMSVQELRIDNSYNP